jgi:hypothetical protein
MLLYVMALTEADVSKESVAFFFRRYGILEGMEVQAVLGNVWICQIRHTAKHLKRTQSPDLMVHRSPVTRVLPNK